MLEWLAATASVELGKLVLEQVINLGKAALEDYVKDFFKDCIKSGIARANAETLKKPMAEAIGFFIKRFVKELQMNDVPETSIEHHYKTAIKRFVQDKAVRPILGKAFETHCKQIDYAQLQQIWTQHYQEAGWQFPAEEFDWRGMAKEYTFEVKGIIKANAELRSLLEAELLETIAQNTANLNTQISPGFNVAKYRESLQCSYGYLKLYTLDSTDRTDAIRLWNIFIEQTVREALPPMRYELPLDLKRQLQEQGQLEADLSSEALERYRQDYFQQPARKALEAVSESQRAVILGDPGAGKSTLLQYLALGWVEGETSALPLLIELREYAIAQESNFLEFLHRGRGVDWQFDQQQLHQYLQENPALVMFDGLDEVFDRATQAAIVDDIIRFSQQYPKAQILVTSRIIGYNPDRLQQAGFSHFTIQALDTDEIHEFIDRWYTLALGNDADKLRLVTRLKDAIANSKAIRNLADNPLLLTMMAILNRRQELPRDRADLYDQASRVLLYHWDVDHKRLQLPMDAIGRREKQEMLRAIAYVMQAGESGLKGNLISTDRLAHLLTTYLRDQGFSKPREKANLLIHQLRERNFILCYRGADTYGFVHRTFLEYFCAIEIVYRFEKQRTLTFAQLRDEVFGQHWQDETWHEVLRLICGAIDPKFAGELIEFLMGIEVDRSQFLDSTPNYRPPGNYLSKAAISNLLLAADCLIEVENRNMIAPTANKLINRFKQEIELEEPYRFGSGAGRALAQAIARAWAGDAQVLEWFKILASRDKGFVRRNIISAIVDGWERDESILSWLKDLTINGEGWYTRERAVREVVRGWKNEPLTLPWLKTIAQLNQEDDWAVRRGALEQLAEHWKEDLDTLPIAKKIAQHDETWAARSSAIATLAKYWAKDLDLFDFFEDIAIHDPGGEKGFLEGDPRFAALKAIVENYPTHPKTLKLLHDRATNEPDEQLQEWAQRQLEQQMQAE